MVLLGFIDEPNGSGDDDTSDWTVSRIGGTPAYPDQLIHEKLKSNLICSQCQREKIFVCQLYCPLVGQPYDRTLYLFACKNSLCWNKSNNWTGVRCQKYDSTYTEKTDDNNDEQPTEDILNNSSADWCDDADDWNNAEDNNDNSFSNSNVIPTTKSASNDHKLLTSQMNKINLEEQLEEEDCVDDGGDGDDDDDDELEMETKNSKKNKQTSSALFDEWKKKNLLEKNNDDIAQESSSSLFPLYYIDIDDEQTILEQERLKEKKKWKNKINREQENTDESSDYTKEPSTKLEHGDIVFYRFQQKIMHAQDQIVRYDYRGQPLIITKIDSGLLSNIKCRHCKESCLFEFQLMPALVNYLKINKRIVLEFGTVFMYTCSANCWNNDNDLFHIENVIVQEPRTENEKFYWDPNDKSKKKFPSLNDQGTKRLSVIIPAYKEAERLPPMMKTTMEYLEKRNANDKSFTYELIIVDDGSPDNNRTTEVALNYSSKYSTDIVRVLKLDKNRGKGGAVRMGVLSCRGEWILFADADGATDFNDYTKLEKRAISKQTKDIIICGSRRHLEKESVAKRSLFRTILMHVFHLEVWLFTVKTIRDTQCGFKLFSRQAAQKTFSQLHVERWAFDVELLYIAEQMGISLEEVDVNWQEIPGSKLDPISASVQMGIDILSIWLRYTVRIWSIKQQKD
ncbi:unnamed protein product [Didymodactylos carnosus]|uniref:Dolichyl-phosphate beta-glucosyltransferase n=1 Tax=Didymodactylos carnosus TaxID=1234261 RepID=A0A813WTS4_9BILA|nr:unnamed protein product [Didymodactylos carnosus]CAF0855411.1 unnamed protein product [Didymodactylos carnosus]CAF3622608.1 unnamed protein product [Didymodactylos carnosus]CAF3643164.1 unnamed protein product [Didymodactylos carnosus]